MEMCFNDLLDMPYNYVELDNNEMEYLDGGVSIEQNILGYKVFLSAQNCGDLAALAAAGSITCGTVSAVLGLTGVGIPFAIAGAIAAGVLGLGSAYMWLCSNHNGAWVQTYYIGNVFLGFSAPQIIW